MGREGQWIKQPMDEPINVSNWKMDDEFPVYPEGARDKTLFYSPEHSSHGFIVPNHRYLYKLAVHRHSEQFWTEIIAYHIGCLLDIPVPPAFVAFDNSKTCGALIEWFLDYPEQNEEEHFIAGGDIMVSFIPSYERKRGQQPAQHIELLVLFANKYPAMLQRMKNKLTTFDITRLKTTINYCTGFDIRIPLTAKRAEFVYHLIESRYLAIRERIEKLP